jgi:hypothetical protein
MARRTKNLSNKVPSSATRITTFGELDELLSRFAASKLPLLAIVGAPGLCKSKAVQKAIKGSRCLYIKGRKSPLDLYCDAYHHQDNPLIFDDPDSIMADNICLEYVKILSETDKYKLLPWGTNTNVLKTLDVPKYFWTTSPVCIITNHWGDSHFYESLESRAELVYFEPHWGELYNQIGKWFWDQEIFDYLYERLEVLKRPDARIVVKAANRKDSGMTKLSWQKAIDDYVDDPPGLLIRKLLAQDFPNNTARAVEFEKQGGGSLRTFYYRLGPCKKSCVS